MGLGLSPNPVLDDKTIKNMKVAELYVALQARGMSKTGIKAVLVDRLKTIAADSVEILQDCPVPEI